MNTMLEAKSEMFLKLIELQLKLEHALILLSGDRTSSSYRRTEQTLNRE